MPKGELTSERRTILLNRFGRLEKMLYPDDDNLAPRGARRARMKDTYFRVLDDYFEHLPRVLMSVCPFTSQPLMRSFDPFGLDGPWWHKDMMGKINEPGPPPTFKVLLGGLRLDKRVPQEAKVEVIPGPETPFVVPRLLRLPGMIAVISELKVQTGDVAYPVAYFSMEEIPPARLHQPWLRQDQWLKTEEGDASWLIATDPWDFDLKPWVDQKKVWWVGERKGNPVALSADSGVACPYLNLPGERKPQIIIDGERDFDDLPSGVPVEPFER